MTGREIHFETIIVGAGFAGAATAYHLARAGRRSVLLLEQEPEPGCHASGKNAGLLRQAVSDPQIAAWVQETRRALEAPPEDWPRRKIFRRSGSILLGEKQALLAFAGMLKSYDAPHEIFDAAAAPEFFPPALRQYLANAAARDALFCPGDGVVAVRDLLANYLDAAQARGARLQVEAGLRALERTASGWILRTTRGEYQARAVVNAAGAWAGAVGALAGLPDPGLQPKRRHLYVAGPGGLPGEFPYLWDTRHEWYFRADPRGLLLCAGDETPHPAGDPPVDPRIEAELQEKLTRYFPALPAVRVDAVWACLRTFWRGGSALIEAEHGAPGFFWVAGLGGHGMGSSFGLGRAAAERVSAFLDRQNS